MGWSRGLYVSLCLTLLNFLPLNIITVDALALKQTERSCGHAVRRLYDDVFYDVHLESEGEIKKRNVDQPLRIHLYFDRSLDHLSITHQNIVKAHVRTAVDFWQSTLRVRATNAPIRLRRKCRSTQVKFMNKRAYCINRCLETTVCGDITIPEEHLEGCMYYNEYTGQFVREPTTSPGVSNTDFILYIATIPSRKCREGQTIAYAAHCQQEQALDRPVAGYFSICPNSISASRQNQAQLLSTMKHEILHALGFTAGLYAFYRASDGRPLTPRNPVSGRPAEFMEEIDMYKWSSEVARVVVRPNWLQRSGVTEKRVYMMVTPRVTEEVRRHFNCPTLEGAELEDQGIDGTVLTHWEKRVFENEAMTGTYTQNSIISRITLAMMEDTGWYKADYSKAGDYEWGRGLGCEFVKNSCYHWISSRMARGESIHPFCDQVKKGELWTDCAHNRHSVALCNLVEYRQSLPAKYQYFDHLPGVPRDEIGKYAGSVALADYCPYLQEFSWTDENNVPVRGSNCQDYENNLETRSNFFGESYGANSLCFEHASKWYLHECSSTRSPQHAGSGCYQYSCEEGIGLSIHVENYTYRCYKDNQVINVAFLSSQYVHQGTVVCPNCDMVCQLRGISCPADREPPRNLPTPRFKNAFCTGCDLTSQRSVHVFLLSIVLVCFSIR